MAFFVIHLSIEILRCFFSALLKVVLTCTTANLEPSHVLRALGVKEDLAHSSIRFGLGRFNTEEEVDYTIKRVVEEVSRLRAMSPFYKQTQRDSRNKNEVQPKIARKAI